jgi:acyl homoserine lactone synthase
MRTIAAGRSLELAGVMGQMHEFRYNVFVKRLGWALPMIDGVEQDQYDTPDTRYVVMRDDDGRVTACARLIPTTHSYMLPELFPQLLGDSQAPCDESVWELSRFATSVRETREGRILSLSKPTLDFLNQILDFARQHEIARLVLVTSIGIERLILRAGVQAHRIAPPDRVDGSLCVALFIEVNQPAMRTATTPRTPAGFEGNWGPFPDED